MSMVDGCNVGRRKLLALLGTGAAATIGGAVSIHGNTGQCGEPVSVTGDVAGHDPLSTRLTQEYGVRFPFVSAGMGFVSYPPLVTAVSNAGGIGVLGNAIEPPPSTRQLIRMIAAGTTGFFGVALLHDTTAFGSATTEEHVHVCIAASVPLVVFHFNVPP